MRACIWRVRARMRQLLAYMRAAAPSMHIVVLGILPRGAWSLPDQYAWPNRLTKTLAAINAASQVGWGRFCAIGDYINLASGARDSDIWGSEACVDGLWHVSASILNSYCKFSEKYGACADPPM